MKLTFESVTFRYRRSGPDVLHEFGWGVSPGRTVLLGPNGAGKTTLLSLAANALRPSKGRITLDQLDPGRRTDRAAYRALTGWMPQATRPIPGFTCREQVAYAAWLKGVDRRKAWSVALHALEAVGLSELNNKLASELSGGQLRRVGLAQALAHDARVLLLDEPTSGLDPAQRAKFRETLTALSDSRTIIVSTHQVDDLSGIFDRVVVVDHGRIRYDGTVASFMDLGSPSAERRAESAYQQLVSGEG
jgi:ABC-2 type transport system ATP-binding protein